MRYEAETHRVSGEMIDLKWNYILLSIIFYGYFQSVLLTYYIIKITH